MVSLRAGRAQFVLTIHALLMGDHALVGPEDNLHLGKGVLITISGKQVAKIRRIAAEFGVKTATLAEARQIHGLKIGSGRILTRVKTGGADVPTEETLDA